MVGQLIRLKLQLTWNTMKRQTWVLVMSIIGIAYFLMMFTGIAIGSIVSALSGEIATVGAVTVFAGAALVLGWIIIPIIFSSLDNTLDPRRLAPFIPPSPRLALGLVGATWAGLAGLGTTMLLLLAVAVWLAGGQALAALATLIFGPLALFTAFTWARAISTWLAVQIEASSRLKDMLTVIGVILFVGAFSPLGIWIQKITESFDPEWIQRSATILSWTPFGAAWGIAHSLYIGHYLAALGQLLIALAFAALGWWAWLKALPYAMARLARPVSAAADSAIAAGRHLVDPTQDTAVSSSTATAGEHPQFLRGANIWQKLGLNTPAASLAARTLRYWIADPRLSTSMAAMLIFPLMAVLMMNTPATGQGMAYVFLVMNSTMMGMTIGSLPSYDSTAFWLLVASGIRGRDERLGRLAGTLPLALPLLIIGTGVVTYFAGYSATGIATAVALQFALFAGATTAAFIISGRYVYPVQPPGSSPLSSRGTGNMMLTMGVQFGSMFASFVLAAPALILAAVAYIGGAFSVLIAAGFALVWGVVLLVAAVIIGGKVWDSSNVDVLQSIRSWPGH
ncbi:hypothetical protein [Schaalia sp. Marseille-Q2122]|uniref:hypothetical protein n=1 Tax=Schaalia sp. Marseille-Q2122 TaxID=2736604 RepID=UPI00158E706A|nr:hypothetical protein [Schaalia sp. Marseille-Q2122]